MRLSFLSSQVKSSQVKSSQVKSSQVMFKFGSLMVLGTGLLSVQAVQAAPVATQTTNQATKPESKPNQMPTAVLDELVIYGDAYRTTATKTALDPKHAPMSYSRIEQNTLKQRQADSVNSALRYEAGVSSESRGTVTVFDEYYVRGFKTHSNFYDGMRLPYDGSWNLMPQVDVYATEAVEVLKGPASSLYGHNEPGGMVNQVAKIPKNHAEHEIKLRLGNQNLKEVGIDSTAPIDDSMSYRVVALARQKNGQMQTAKEERLLLNPSVSFKPNDNVSVIASLYYQNDPHMVPSTPLPGVGTVYNASYGKLKSNAFAGDKWNDFSKKVFMPSETVNWQINDALKFKHSLRYTDANAQQKNTYHSTFADKSDRVLKRTAYTTDETLRNWATDNQLAYTLFTDIASHNLLFGVDYQHTKSSAKYNDAFEKGIPPIDLAKPDHDLFAKTQLDLSAYQKTEDIKQRQLGVYVQDEMQWDKLTVVAGLRHDSYNSTSQAKDTYGAKSPIKSNINHTSGRLAGMYQLDNGFSPYVVFSQSFQPLAGQNPTTQQPYKPTTANQLEAGLKYQSAAGLNANFALYDIVKKNERVNNGDWTKVTQTGEIESKGFEISADHTLNDWLGVGVAYGYVDAKITEDEFDPKVIGNTPQQIAKHKASLWANITPNDKTSLNLGVRHQAGMQIDRQNSDTLPGVTLVDLAGSYQISPMLNAGLSVSNLFNKTYVGTCYDKNNCWMGPERQASVSLTAKF
ncbi:TonB-dependent siderophore receptor [Moraxella macacae 0408225]|uniref:TonB-dependent siderophore receptor n=1 Tax=Moraxella macacae 0408225 TaxID=1230338 RepID=L2F969_9GAMM|nr:TonB-dependent siderophore receptor [Moraxella macacae]ELA09321.1 TonB-dependent siderophore receptor [Moraxella macacae 0408225]